MTVLYHSKEVFKHYWDLGFISFGGPGVHVIILRKRFVQTLKWVDETVFLDLFALGDALPGPGSTQLAFSIAVVCHGVLAGLLAFLLWSLPGAIGMAVLGYGVGRIPHQIPAIVMALLTGLNAAAVGLIALAAVQLAHAAATDKITLIILWLSASFGICYHAPWMYPVLIVGGGCATLLWDFRRLWLITPIRRLVRKRQPQLQEQHGDIPLEPIPERRSPAATVNDNASLRERASIRKPSYTGDAVVPEVSAVPPPPAAVLERPGSIRSVSNGGESSRSVRPRASPSEEDPLERAEPVEREQEARKLKVIPTPVACALLLGFVLFLAVPLGVRGGLKHAGKHISRAFDFFCSVLIPSVIIFGGGPVVIPLLRDYVVTPGFVSDRDFLLVFSILQAFPGPNFNFAVALGVITLSPVGQPVLGAFLGYIGIFATGILLKLALLPIYVNWKDLTAVRAVIRGLNAAASGLVFTAVWQLFLVGYIYASGEGDKSTSLSGPLTADPFWAVVASGSFLASYRFSSPAWASVLGGGVAGLAWYGVQQSK